MLYLSYSILIGIQKVKPHVIGDDREDGECPEVQDQDLWHWTLGKEQYIWFKETLEKYRDNKDIRFKMVFAHQVIGGSWYEKDGNRVNSCYGRGGKRAVENGYEWGADPEEFCERRKDWDKNCSSIHKLMVENHVDIFFHGHDHVYAKEEKDGIIYQEVPRPAPGDGFAKNASIYSDANETGAFIPNSGHISVTVDPSKLLVKYIQSYPPEEENKREIAHKYKVRYRDPDETAEYHVYSPKEEDNYNEYEYPRIQLAIDAAPYENAVITVHPHPDGGAYEENIKFSGKAITVRGTDPNDCIIDGKDEGVVVRFVEGDKSILKGITIRNGKGKRGGGIRCRNSSPKIINCNIIDNEADCGGGIFC